MLSFLWRKSEARKNAQIFYDKAVTQARQPGFYRDMYVPDTLDGRFEMISLHVIMIMVRMKGEKNAQKINQALFDVMFVDIEKNLREIGIGDLSVPKHMKRMMNGFNGRLQAYRSFLETLPENPSQDSVDILKRNIFGTVDDVPPSVIIQFYKYSIEMQKKLNDCPAESLIEMAFTVERSSEAA